MIKKFIEVFTPNGSEEFLTAERLKDLERLLPPLLIDLYRLGGIGNYADGLLKVIDPEVYHPTLMDWLMKEEPDYSRIPFALTSTGGIIYYRRLSEDVEDISFIDPHTSDVFVVAYSAEAFISRMIDDPKYCDSLLERELFINLLAKFGKIPPSEIYYYEPALRLGG